MNLLVIHQHSIAAGQPGGSRFREFGRHWIARGHGVTLIAGALNYATGEVPADLVGRVVTKRDEDGVEVWRCHVPRTYNSHFLGRLWSFAGFLLSGALAVLRSSRPDVVIASSPPLTTALLGWFAAVRHRVPWVFEVRDIWPESAITTGVISRHGAFTRALFALERFACSRADRICVLTPAFRDDLLARRLATEDRILFAPNGADLSLMAPASRETEFRRTHKWGERFVALYAGAHGRANALMQLVDAAECLRDRTDILIVTVGDGPERTSCAAAARERGLTNIEFLGPVAKEQMAEVINSADAGLAVLQNNPTFLTVYPNKAFDYMACGRPTVLAIDGVARDLVCKEANAGLFAAPEDGAALAAAIVELADHPERAATLGRNGHNWVVANASRETLADRYVSALEALVR